MNMTREENIPMTNMPDRFQSAAQTKTSPRQSGSVYSTVTLQPQKNSEEMSLSVILIQMIVIDLLVREFVLPLQYDTAKLFSQYLFTEVSFNLTLKNSFCLCEGE